jgi:O-glycosyl hydrolase
MTFDADGLQPSVVKMFLSSHLLPEPPQPGVIDLDKYRFAECMAQTIYFAKEGIRRSREQGITLRFMITMYGPPAWGNQQKIIRGKDLDPAMRDALATYLAGCALYLREREGIPVEAISLHNEGEDPNRYPGHPGDDFNMYWKPDQIADMIARLRQQLDAAGLSNIAVAPGETTLWSRFEPYAWAIAGNPQARNAIGLITSHGFGGDFGTQGIRFLHQQRPDLKVWTTSCSWYNSGGVDFARNYVDQINKIGVNALIPWALIQTPPKWPGGDPNPNPPFLITDDRGVEVNKSYYYYKQFTQAGRPGMVVAEIGGDYYNSLYALAFAGSTSQARNAFLIVNAAEQPHDVYLTLAGSSGQFALYRTDAVAESYQPIGEFRFAPSASYTAPPASVSTFFESGKVDDH